jgi:hypothetical protein
VDGYRALLSRCRRAPEARKQTNRSPGYREIYRKGEVGRISWGTSNTVVERTADVAAPPPTPLGVTRTN